MVKFFTSTSLCVKNMAMFGTVQRAIFKLCHSQRSNIAQQLQIPLHIRQISLIRRLETSNPKLPHVCRTFKTLSYKPPKVCSKSSEISVPKQQLNKSTNTSVLPLKSILSKNIHTSPNRNAIPPIVWVFLRPLLNISVIVFGKIFKKWWRKRTPEEKEAFWRKLRKNRPKILGAFGGLGLLGALYYYTHLELEPLTGRTRFMMLHNKDMEQLTNEIVEAMVVAKDVLPVTHPYYTQVQRVMKRLLAANREILVERGITRLKVHVLDAPETNAVVFPNCTVVIFSGLFKLCHNDDQLAAILGHELAHAVLNHQAEMMCKEQIMDALMLIVLLFVWATIPDLAAFLWQLVSIPLSQIFVKLPFSREMELEADATGLKLIAKACFDVREAIIVWGKLSFLEEIGANIQPPEIISTHPANKRRQEILEKLIPDALELRDACKCSKLPRGDPRVALELWKRQQETSLLKQKAQAPGAVARLKTVNI